MKTSNLLVAAAVALFAAAGAQAETYDGVHALTHQRTRADVTAEATVAAHSPNPYAEGANEGVISVVNGDVDRGAIRAEAVAKSHDPFASLDRRAFYRDTIPTQYTNGSLAIRQQVRRQASL
jgi:hypothetical protein